MTTQAVLDTMNENTLPFIKMLGGRITAIDADAGVARGVFLRIIVSSAVEEDDSSSCGGSQSLRRFVANPCNTPMFMKKTLYQGPE